MGGVIITLNHDEAVRRFSALGLQKADEVLNPYCQAGIFGDLEEGKLSLEEYQEALEKMVGRKLSLRKCAIAGWVMRLMCLPISWLLSAS